MTLIETQRILLVNFQKPEKILDMWYGGYLSLEISFIDELVKTHKLDGTVKSFRCKARESLGMRRTYKYVGMTKDEAQRCRWTFYEAVNY